MRCSLPKVLALFAVLACSSGQAAAAGIAPKMVIQLGHGAPVSAVVWTTDSRHLFSLAEDGSIVAWDVSSTVGSGVRGGVVLDSARVPWPEGKEFPKLRSFTLQPGNITARLVFAPDEHCPPAATGADQLCAFDLDLATRALEPVQLDAPVATTPEAARFPVSPDGRWKPRQNHGDGVNGLFDPADENIDFTEADCTSRALCRYGVNLNSTDAPAVKVALTGIRRSYFEDADVSRDGRHLVRLESIRNNNDARVQQLDLVDAGPVPTFFTKGAYRRVQWLDGERHALFSAGYNATNDLVEVNAPLPAVVIDAACAARNGGADCPRIPPHGLMRALRDGAFVGTGTLERCYRARRVDRLPDELMCIGGDSDEWDGRRVWRRLQFYSPATGQWTVRTPLPELQGWRITAIEVGPDQHTIAVAAISLAKQPTLKVVLLDASPTVPVRVAWSVPAPEAGAPPIEHLAFDTSGKTLVFGHAGSMVIVDPTGARPTREWPVAARSVATDGRHAFLLERRALVNLDTGVVMPVAVPAGDLVRAGFIDGKSVAWAASTEGTVYFWNAATGADLLTLYSFTDNRYFALAPDGRYDTNLGPDATEVRWLMADAPWQSLAAQTFMRDYYEPRLLARLLSCTGRGDCDRAFAALRPLDQVNRVLPQVTVESVVAGAPGTVQVCVSARSVAGTVGTATRASGLHDLRLFRDGRMVAGRGAAPASLDPDDRAAWARQTAIADQACPDTGAGAVATFTVAVPQGAAREVAFTAYAFNSDRVKGDTSPPVTYRVPAVATPRQPRAYVIAIGVNDYPKLPEKSLRFAVNDARAVATALRDIEGHAVTTLTLTSEPGRHLAMKAQIRAVLALLAGREVEANRALLAAAGIEADALARSTPDDAVVITFSGHGVADPRGRFFLLPADAAWAADTPGEPDWSTLISSAELTDWLREVDAGDIAVVIDACHSAASVAAGQFKPGPMGDPGLGQLAYDKGLRILAATQGDDVALEDERLQQGLLTFALTGKGEALAPGRAVTLDAWLRYGMKRMPTLAADVRVGRVATAADGTRGFTFLNATPAKKLQVQEPSLFDFTGQPSAVKLQAPAP